MLFRSHLPSWSHAESQGANPISADLRGRPPDLLARQAVNVHIPGHEQRAFTHGRGAGVPLGGGGPEIWREVAKCPATNVGQRSLVASDESVEKDGDIKIAHPGGRGITQRSCSVSVTFVKSYVGNDINDAEAGVHTIVIGEIEDINGVANKPLGVMLELFIVVNQRKDAPIMERVGVAVSK